jgi:ribonuclease P protein component
MLSRKNRLSASSEIETIKRLGDKIHTDYFIVLYSSNSLGYPRASFVVSPKISRLAVKRNRIRRLISESLRLSDDFKDIRFDLVLIAKQSVLGASFKSVSGDIGFMLTKLKNVQVSS